MVESNFRSQTTRLFFEFLLLLAFAQKFGRNFHVASFGSGRKKEVSGRRNFVFGTTRGRFFPSAERHRQKNRFRGKKGGKFPRLAQTHTRKLSTHSVREQKNHTMTTPPSRTSTGTGVAATTATPKTNPTARATAGKTTAKPVDRTSTEGKKREYFVNLGFLIFLKSAPRSLRFLP